MSIQFILSPVKNNIKNPQETRYYPRAIHTEVYDFERIAEIISESSTVTDVDCHAVMIGMERVMRKALQEGAIVKLGNFGSFQISLNGESTDDPEALGKNLIKSAKIIYRPGKKMKDELKHLTYLRKRPKNKTK